MENLAELVAEHQGSLFAFLYRMCGNADMAEELMQETFVRAPGCGADTAKDAAFCVRCGFSLRPSCPDCRRLVGTDWSYCATCGRSFSE